MVQGVVHEAPTTARYYANARVGYGGMYLSGIAPPRALIVAALSAQLHSASRTPLRPHILPCVYLESSATRQAPAAPTQLLDSPAHDFYHSPLHIHIAFSKDFVVSFVREI